MTSMFLTPLSLQTWSGRWADARKVGDGSRESKEKDLVVAQPQLLGLQDYPACTSKKARLEETEVLPGTSSQSPPQQSQDRIYCITEGILFRHVCLMLSLLNSHQQ